MAAVRPKTLSQARAAYSSNQELAWWVFMRISGLALVFLVFGHLFMTNIAINAGEIDWRFVASRLNTPWVKVYDSFLLGLAMLHGANGVRYSLEDYIRSPSARFFAKALFMSLTVAVFAFGLIALWAIDFTRWGVPLNGQ
jgi:succinate dehydrogenase / fumarate reductase, membrane anchor subunit